MKIAKCLAGCILLSAVANASTISLSGGGTGRTFVTSQGATIVPGSGVSLQVGLLNTLTGAWTQFAPLDATAPTFVASGTLAGKWSGNASDNSSAADPFNGLQIWYRVTAGGGTAFFTATGVNFPTNASGSGDTLTFSSANLTSFSTEWSSAGTSLTATQAIVGVVPEPSVALLGGLGLLALIRRRR